MNGIQIQQMIREADTNGDGEIGKCMPSSFFQTFSRICWVRPLLNEMLVAGVYHRLRRICTHAVLSS